MANDKTRLPSTLSRLIFGHFVGVYSAVHHGFNFLVRLSSRLQVNAHEQFPVYPVARLRNVPLVFFEREHFERDEFSYRKFLPRQKNRLPRGAAADCENYFRAGRAHFFCRRAVRHVRDLRLPAHDLQPATDLLSGGDDLFHAGDFVANEFADDFSSRYWAIRGDDFAIRILGHAHFLELENDSRAVSNFFKAKSRVLSG